MSCHRWSQCRFGAAVGEIGHDAGGGIVAGPIGAVDGGPAARMLLTLVGAVPLNKMRGLLPAAPSVPPLPTKSMLPPVPKLVPRLRLLKVNVAAARWR